MAHARPQPSRSADARHHPDHPALRAVRAQRQELLDMAMAVVDLGSRRRTLLFLRADQLAHFVSCLVYLPRDRYTTAVRLAMQDILVRELGGDQHRLRRPGQRITLGGRAFHGPAARRLTSAGRRRLAGERDADPGPAHRGGPHLGRPAARRGQDRSRSTRPTPSTTPRRSPRSTSRRSRRMTPSPTSRSSKSCRTIRSSWSSSDGERGRASRSSPGISAAGRRR